MPQICIGARWGTGYARRQDELGNWVLQALGARELSVPFVASGGVGCGRQLAAALALGASGVSMGTRFIATREVSAIESSIGHKGKG